jgi:hypothetical protein
MICWFLPVLVDASILCNIQRFIQLLIILSTTSLLGSHEKELPSRRLLTFCKGDGICLI